MFASFIGQTLSKAVDTIPDGQGRKAVLGMKVFYKTVIKDLPPKKLPISDPLLKALTCLNLKEQCATDSLQHWRVVASQMHSVGNNEELSTGGEWV